MAYQTLGMGECGLIRLMLLLFSGQIRQSLNMTVATLAKRFYWLNRIKSAFRIHTRASYPEEVGWDSSSWGTTITNPIRPLFCCRSEIISRFYLYQTSSTELKTCVELWASSTSIRTSSLSLWVSSASIRTSSSSLWISLGSIRTSSLNLGISSASIRILFIQPLSLVSEYQNFVVESLSFVNWNLQVERKRSLNSSSKPS